MSTLIVVPVIVRHQTVELPDGSLIAVQLENPGHGFAVAHQTTGSTQIISLHRSEEEAVHRVKELATLLETSGGEELGKAGGRRTLQ
ncbi:hypothetical protein ACTOV4_23490 [Brucella sp. C7-11G]